MAFKPETPSQTDYYWLNCPGGCPFCAPDEHDPRCVRHYYHTEDTSHSTCICDTLQPALPDKDTTHG